jgi:tetratricopeptide (TPR) repeat protein
MLRPQIKSTVGSLQDHVNSFVKDIITSLEPASLVTLLLQIHSYAHNSTDNLLLMGAVQYHLGNFQQSVQCNDICILIDPTIAEAHANLANSLQQLGHLAMAALYYQVCHRLRSTMLRSPVACCVWFWYAATARMDAVLQLWLNGRLSLAESKRGCRLRAVFPIPPP